MLLFVENPLCEIDDYRIETCMTLRKLERLDKDEFSEDERADAEEVSMYSTQQYYKSWYQFFFFSYNNKDSKIKPMRTNYLKLLLCKNLSAM